MRRKIIASNTPKVSIIIPVYNAEAFLSQCLDSVINQTLKEIEVICINDGSTDGSGKVLDLYAQKDVRIRVIHKCNEGVAAARNVGLSVASGDYVGFVDSDDWIDADFYEKLYTSACATKADVVKGGRISFNSSGWSGISTLNDRILKNKNHHIAAQFLYEWFTGLFSREIIVKNKICFYNACLGEDVHFLLRVMLVANNLEIVNDTFYHYFVRSNSASHNISQKSLDDLYHIYKSSIDIIKKAKIDQISSDIMVLDRLKYYASWYTWVLNKKFLGFWENLFDLVENSQPLMLDNNPFKGIDSIKELKSRIIKGNSRTNICRYYLFGFIPLLSVEEQ